MKTMATGSASRRLATNARAWALAWSSHWEVVYRTEDRLRSGDVANEAQKGEADQKPVRRSRFSQPHGLQGGPLRAWQPGQAGRQWLAQLMKAGERQLHF